MMRTGFVMTLVMTTALVPCVLARTPDPLVPDMGRQALTVQPQDNVLPVTLATLAENRIDIDQALVVVEMGQGEDNPRWLLSPTQLEVMLDTLLQFMPETPTVEDAIWPKLKAKDPKYKGMRVVLRTVWGRHFEPITIFEGGIRTAGGRLIVPDYGRRMEYWMFGASRVRRDQMTGAHVLHVLTFEQCRLLGQPIVETRPRQCLLPDNNLLLETSELPTLQAAKIKDFDGCLTKGKALIYTFPRRCIAAGGRVFTEPPRVYDVPGAMAADAPLAGNTLTSGTLGGLVPASSLPAATPAVDVMSGGEIKLAPVGAGSPIGP